ncbi:unnamed protein product [Caenorhabditis bovis]|uniref:Uncharacterized protein n=1 Tax=Caenorhabditis bovis TaxID=2654633 RepID=A0A8S1F403_9PELO|nr:unnamed protein product [Caenorhabditis bovis]
MRANSILFLFLVFSFVFDLSVSDEPPNGVEEPGVVMKVVRRETAPDKELETVERSKRRSSSNKRKKGRKSG